MVSDLAEFIDDHNIINPVIIGHSMGGKTAMNFALTHPEKIDKLIVVDISPRAYDLEHYAILDGLNAIPINTIIFTGMKQMKFFRSMCRNLMFASSCLKNLQRKPTGGFSWKINLPVLTQKLSNIGLDLQVNGTFTKPTLFIRGARSNYVQDSDWDRITNIFPEATLETMETAIGYRPKNQRSLWSVTDGSMAGIVSHIWMRHLITILRNRILEMLPNLEIIRENDDNT